MRVAVIADVHGNALALESVLADIAGQGADAIVNLGDHLSGPLEPRRTADMLAGLDALSIRGNHDRYLIDERLEDMDPVDRFTFEQLDGRHLDWLRSLPETAVFEDAIFLCHGTPDSDDTHWLQTKNEANRFFYTPLAQIESDALHLDFPLICCGHSHVGRVARLADGRIVFNPGSVGRPAYTMGEPESAARLSPDAGYALATRADAGWTVELRQVAYDHQRASAMALERGSKGAARDLLMGWQR